MELHKSSYMLPNSYEFSCVSNTRGHAYNGISCINLDAVKAEYISFHVELLTCGTVCRTPLVLSLYLLISFQYQVHLMLITPVLFFWTILPLMLLPLHTVNITCSSVSLLKLGISLLN